MRIGIDARWIFGEASGIGVYTRELVARLIATDKENSYALFFDSRERLDRIAEELAPVSRGNLSSSLLPYGLFSLRNQILGPHALARERLDVFHSTNYMIPLAAFPRGGHGRIACVVTIHDVIPLVLPGHAPRSRKSRLFAVYKWLMREVGRRASMIITVSDVSRADVLKHLEIPGERADMVRTVYDGVSERFRPATGSSGSRARNAGEPRTVLYVGRADPYKNCVRLVEAFAALRGMCAFPVVLKIVGPRDPRYPEAERRAAELGLGQSVQWGYVAGEDLVGVYQEADVLAMPSLYEGFGLPVAEAMACGTPVVCSNRGALPEVVGDAAIQVEPEDVPGLSRALARVLTEPALAAGMSARGVERARQFTWDRAAAQTIEVYKAAVGSARR